MEGDHGVKGDVQVEHCLSQGGDEVAAHGEEEQGEAE